MLTTERTKHAGRKYVITFHYKNDKERWNLELYYPRIVEAIANAARDIQKIRNREVVVESVTQSK